MPLQFELILSKPRFGFFVNIKKQKVPYNMASDQLAGPTLNKPCFFGQGVYSRFALVSQWFSHAFLIIIIRHKVRCTRFLLVL